jgi:proline dehydrogenase
MLRSLLLHLSERELKFLTTHPLVRRLARRFIAGEELPDALEVVKRLNADGFDVTLDYLGESVREASRTEEACRAYLSILDRLRAERLRSHISVKLTHLGLDVDQALAGRHLRAICDRAARYQNFVRIDMESSAHTEATLRLFREANAPRDVLGVVIQAYLRRSEKDVEELLRFGARIRLVKGAYKEPPELAFPRKRDVDRNFVRLTETLLSSGIYHAIATHDRHLISSTKAFARARGLTADQFEFQLLYGIQRPLQREQREQGYRVRVYVPYGKQWYPYFMRRLAERPANLLFLMRSLFRG